jgi:hypothetical protein
VQQCTRRAYLNLRANVANAVGRLPRSRVVYHVWDAICRAGVPASVVGYGPSQAVRLLAASEVQGRRWCVHAEASP